jgi:hypothetical protein
MLKDFLSATTVLVLLSSCVEPIDIATDNAPPMIVVYGYLTNEPAFHSIRVSASSPYFDQSFNRTITGAFVKITSSENETFILHELDTVPGTYMTATKIAGTPGVTYSLSVETDFDDNGISETYSAVSTMPEIVAVDSIQVKSVPIMGYTFYSVNLYAQDTPAEDYYFGRYAVNDSIVMFQINQIALMPDGAFNGQYINGMTIQRFWDQSEKEKLEREYNNDDDTLRRRIYLSPGDTLAFSLCHIEKGYSNFIEQCQEEMSGENPFFGGPASNIITNISNGGLGYFSTYAISTVKTVVGKKP